MTRKGEKKYGAKILTCKLCGKEFPDVREYNSPLCDEHRRRILNDHVGFKNATLFII